MFKKYTVLYLVLILVSFYFTNITNAAETKKSGDEDVPVDIQANEQQFLEKQIVAKGNVHVKYKDCNVSSNEVIMYRDDEGTAQRAVFTGRPRLVQKTSQMQANKLEFEIANQKIVAIGNAHSVIISNPTATDAANSVNNKSKDDKKDSKKDASKPVTPEDENIITDSDQQIYDQDSGEFKAQGHVRVKRGDLQVKADSLTMYYGDDGNPETAMFKGNVLVVQHPNETYCDSATYALNTKRLQANGHVKSKVIQEGNSDTKKNSQNKQIVDNSNNSKNSNNKSGDIRIDSDSQDYSSTNGRITAIGNVKFVTDDATGYGPKMVIMRNEDTGKTDRIIFYGRSQFKQDGKSWIADHIEMDMESNKVIASGNTKAMIIQVKKKKTTTTSPASDNSSYSLASKDKNLH